MLERIWEKQTLPHCWWECKFGAVTVENNMRFLKSKNRVLILVFANYVVSLSRRCCSSSNSWSHECARFPVHQAISLSLFKFLRLLSSWCYLNSFYLVLSPLLLLQSFPVRVFFRWAVFHIRCCAWSQFYQSFNEHQTRFLWRTCWSPCCPRLYISTTAHINFLGTLL